MLRSNLAWPGELHSVRRDLVIPTSAATPVTIGKDVYLVGGFRTSAEVETAETAELETAQKKLVQIYNMDSGGCRTLPQPSLQYNSAAVAIDDNLVLIGGCDSSTGDPTNMLSRWKVAEERWTEVLPPMKKKRNRPGAALLLNKYLCVFGGIGEDEKTLLDSIEVLDLTTKQWSEGGGRLPQRLSQPPQPLHSPQLGVFGDYVMLYGGFTSESADTESRDCYTVPVQALVDSVTNPLSPPIHWTPVQCNTPFNSALLTTSRYPVLIGGYNRAERKVTGAIHRFSRSSGSWEVLADELSEPRLLPTVVAVDDGSSFLVLGGGSSGHPMKSLLKSIELMVIRS